MEPTPGVPIDSFLIVQECGLNYGCSESTKRMREFLKELNSPRAITKPIGAKNPNLQNAINQLFRENNSVPGGTAGAIWQEILTNKPVGGTFHTIKELERVSQLRKLINKGVLSESNLSIAKYVLNDLLDALAGRF